MDEELETVDQSDDAMLAAALIALAPAFVGGAIGGKDGVMAGGAIGAKSAAGLMEQKAKDQAEAEKTARAAKAKEQERQQGIRDQMSLAEYKASLEKPSPTKQVLTKNALGQVIAVDPVTGKSTVIDASQTPVKPAAGTLGDGDLNPRKEKLIDTAGKELGKHGELFTAIGAVEKQLGFPLEKVSDDGKVDGKALDLPGVSIPGFGRVTAYDENARLLRSRIAKIFNVELKDRSGAAVTDSELNRLKDEFAAGKFNSEKELLGALRDYKAAAKAALANAEARYHPEVLAEFENRGGFTSNRLGETPAPKGLPTPEEARAELERRKAEKARASSK